MIWFLVVALAAVTAAFFYLRSQHGPAIALGGAMLVSFWFPTYWIVEIAGLPFSVQSASAVVALTMFLITGGSLRFRLTVCDIAIGLMVVIQIVSDGWFHGRGWTTIFSAYGEWILPYAAGRYAFGSVSAIRNARFLVAGFFVIGVAIWLVNLVTGINLAFELTQMFSDWEAPLQPKRFSLIRSAGLTEHPIFFSGVLMLLVPVLAVSFCKNRRESPSLRYLIGMVLLMLVSITLSRAAVLVCLLALIGSVLITFPRSRIAGGLSIAVVAILVACFPGHAKRLWLATGDFSDERKQIMTVNGEEMLHSSSLARLRIYDVYGKSALNAGLLGYGTEAVREFPPNVPYLPREASATKTLWTVENSYLLMILRFGWSGLFGFICLVLSPLVLLYSEWDLDRRTHLRTLSMGVFAMAVLLVTVYPAYQMIFPLIWLIGLVNAVADPSITPRGPKQANGSDSAQ